MLLVFGVFYSVVIFMLFYLCIFGFVVAFYEDFVSLHTSMWFNLAVETFA